MAAMGVQLRAVALLSLVVLAALVPLLPRPVAGGGTDLIHRACAANVYADICLGILLASRTALIADARGLVSIAADSLKKSLFKAKEMFKELITEPGVSKNTTALLVKCKAQMDWAESSLSHALDNLNVGVYGSIDDFMDDPKRAATACEEHIDDCEEEENPNAKKALNDVKVGSDVTLGLTNFFLENDKGLKPPKITE